MNNAKARLVHFCCALLLGPLCMVLPAGADTPADTQAIENLIAA